MRFTIGTVTLGGQGASTMSTNGKDSKGTPPPKVVFTGPDFLAEILDYTSDTDRAPDREELGSRPTAILTQRVADNISAVVQSAVGLPLESLSPGVRDVVLGAIGEPLEWGVLLEGLGPGGKVRATKVYRAHSGADLRDSKRTIESCPVTVASGVSEATARQLVGEFERAGATAVLIRPDQSLAR